MSIRPAISGSRTTFIFITSAKKKKTSRMSASRKVTEILSPRYRRLSPPIVWLWKVAMPGAPAAVSSLPACPGSDLSKRTTSPERSFGSEGTRRGAGGAWRAISGAVAAVDRGSRIDGGAATSSGDLTGTKAATAGAGWGGSSAIAALSPRTTLSPSASSITLWAAPRVRSSTTLTTLSGRVLNCATRTLSRGSAETAKLFSGTLLTTPMRSTTRRSGFFSVNSECLNGPSPTIATLASAPDPSTTRPVTTLAPSLCGATAGGVAAANLRETPGELTEGVAGTAGADARVSLGTVLPASAVDAATSAG